MPETAPAVVLPSLLAPVGRQDWPNLEDLELRDPASSAPILVATDLSNRGRRAIARALQIAEQTRSAIHLVHAVPIATDALECQRLETELHDLAAEFAGQGGSSIPVGTEVIRGTAATTLAVVAEELGARLIVVGGHGRSSWTDAVLGTTVERLLKQTRRPLLVVGADPRGPYRRAIAAIDDIKAARATLELALLFSTVRRITAVWALPSRAGDWLRPGEASARRQKHEQEELERLIIGHLSGVPAPPLADVIAKQGDLLSMIEEACAAYQPDLIAIASRRTGFARLGLQESLAELLIEHAPADLILRQLD